MSVANVEQHHPPLLFGQPSSAASFSSPPQSPNALSHAQTPVSSPPPPPRPADDVDMSASATTLPPAGQRHDREDAEMQDGDSLANGHVEANTNHPTNASAPPSHAHNNVAVAVAAVDEDAMDTTPDNSQALVPPPDHSADPQGTPWPTSPAPNGAAPGQENGGQPPAEPPTGDSVPSENGPPVEPASSADPSVQQPPPPPPPVGPIESESDSSDDEDSWHSLHEDTSTPDEAEMQVIESRTEHSALEHEYWEELAFQPLDEPEYTAGESGRIHWSIDAFNGTREKPNREIVMLSDPVTIGGYEWRIRLYPHGNNPPSDCVSVFVECMTVENASSRKSKEQTESDKTAKDGEEMVITEEAPAPADSTSIQSSPSDNQHTPLPLLDMKPIPKSRAIAAQVCVVMYNPEEPRTLESKVCQHRFCSGEFDWGWKRFRASRNSIARRRPGERQALLRNDKLALTAYIRLVHDETNCLWEHTTEKNPYDSFSLTGLQSLMLGGGTGLGGNLISAIASWLLFKPFRNFLYKFPIPDLDYDPFAHPKPLISALQKVLFMLRTQVHPGAGSVTLEDILDALEWYGIHEKLDKKDVIEIWELLRLKMEDELQGTPYTDVLEDLFGPKRDYTTGIPSYRAPVACNISSMQDAINNSSSLTLPGHLLPQMLTVELDRQEFDTTSRSYVKVVNKISLDEKITLQDTPYTLFGFIAHDDNLQSYKYKPILRPEGPGTKWYCYSDSNDGNTVKCLPKREAIELHQGRSGSSRIVGKDNVAYVAMYVRDDIAPEAFSSDAEEWSVPAWVQKEVERQQSPHIPPPMPPPLAEQSESNQTPGSHQGKEHQPDEKREQAVLREFQVIDSRAFLQYEGPGFFDPFNPKWQSHKFVSSVQLASNDGCPEIREKLAKLMGDSVKDARQVKFWFLDPIRGAVDRPNLLGTGKIEYSSGSFDRYTDNSFKWALQDLPCSWDSYRIWVHIIDFADLPKLPEPEPQNEPRHEATELAEVPPPSVPTDHAHITEEQARSPQRAPAEETAPIEDTPMSEPDEPAIDQPSAGQLTRPAVSNSATGDDAAMADPEPGPVAEPTVVHVVVPPSPPPPPTAPADAEMEGAQDDLPPPPPPPTDLQTEPVPPPPAPPVEERPLTPPPPPDEIYFFVKYFDAEKQTLEARGSRIMLKSERVDHAVSTLLGLPQEQKLDLWEEEELAIARPIKLRRTFFQADLHNTSIIIASLPLSAAQKSSLASRAAFADPQAFLNFRCESRNFPSRLNGFFTYNRFSSQYYKGEIVNGHPHGHGFFIYDSGATYNGGFRLSLRHGHGLHIFQNGDTYDGNWEEDQQHGTGTFVDASTGNTYVGGWKNDKKFGEGVTHWKAAQETERLCRICWEEDADAAFYDCGHVVACLGCARQVNDCPVCRKRVVHSLKLWYVV